MDVPYVLVAPYVCLMGVQAIVTFEHFKEVEMKLWILKLI